MRLFLSLPVLVVVLSMVLEGPAPAQGAPDVSSALDKLKEFGNTLEDKAREVINRIKHSELSHKMRDWFSETFQKVKEKLKINT
ncbi:apolipoprotein C-I isoform X2 [Symphalangus syndactylus]|uniref:apolipoprotein C-I isoform X2 n=1 Tax=Symphalangus syndactylus TaxID=9590 RepID=UPI002442F326|nr:apolipoprotein C-I, basic form [Symphalangus syndactylus]XP_055107192.1 apolipoprotein C-I, basic form [Symphalangus syndactylus]